MKFKNKLFLVSLTLTVVIVVGFWNLVFYFIQIPENMQIILTCISLVVFIQFYKWKVEKEVIETLKELS